MTALILKLDISGRPVQWISKEQAAVLYCKDQIAWEAGENWLTIRGGRSRLTGEQSYLDLCTIVASRGVVKASWMYNDVPALTNTRLFRRDDHRCLYCGQLFTPAQLTRDHVIPLSKGGRNRWDNVVTACKPCNARKDDMLPKQAEDRGLALLAVPYQPNRAEGLILANRRILADQMSFLGARIGRDSRLHHQ